MLNEIREHFINFITSRFFILILVITVLFGTLTYRLFVLQIVNGASYQENFTLKILKEQSIQSTRGKIYDVNGTLLAYDELAYSVTLEDNYDSAGSTKNREINDTIYRLIKIIEGGGSEISTEFGIEMDAHGNYRYALDGKALLRFLADIYGYSQTSELKLKEKTATAQEVVEYLASANKFGVGQYTENKKGSYDFAPMEGLSKSDILKILNVRYNLSLNGYQKYIATTVATQLDPTTVAIIMENKSDLQGVDIAEDTIRRYIDEPALSPILGYTGIISQTELEQYNSQGEDYERNDMVGRAGIELEMEKQLRGQKGYRQVFVDNVGKVVEVASETEPVAGNDLYLTIDAKLQDAVYHILEQKLAGIVVSHIRNIKDFEQGDADASSIMIPIDDVYYALFNNSVIDISHLSSDDAGVYEKQIQQAYNQKEQLVLETLRNELLSDGTVYSELDKEYQVYESFITSMLSSSDTGIIMVDKVSEKDETYLAWKNETISLAKYLRYAIANEWIDITKLQTSEEYSDSQEVYNILVNTIIDELGKNNNFSKKIYKYMISDENISGIQICMTLYEQGAITEDVATKRELESGELAPYSFMIDKIKNIEITPAQLALDPCTASCVVTDVETGEVRACVSYPSYDNNRLANTIDADYYNRLRNDLSNPLYSYATQQKTAPGSTFKMVSAMAGLKEGVITTGEQIECLGMFDKVDNPKCWKFPSNHGPLTVSGGITNSCNFFFYEVGYRLGAGGFGNYNSDNGLEKLSEYADQFGLLDLSGIELTESEPTISTEDSVRSAIGQGTNSFATVQLARYVNTVANSGNCFNISLLDKLTDSEGDIIEDYSPELRNVVEAPNEYWSSIHSGMKGVVENATAFKDSGLEAAGKTGTAQQVKNRPDHALFVGYAPYYTPEISIATRIAYGYTSANAAEASRDVFQYYFNVKDPDDILTGEASVPTSGIISD